MSAPLPFQWMAEQYFKAGWSPLPLPYKTKNPVPKGYTGATGKYVDAEDMRRWTAKKARISVGNLNYQPGNVALRLPKDVIGIDVDAHSGKAGLETFSAALAEWGPLPATWVTTSKTDGVSGIRLYRVPEGLAWPGELPFGKGVELIRWDHRFAIVYPSIHDKTGAEYGWFREVPHGGDTAVDEWDGLGQYELVAAPDDFPEPGELAELPATWVEGLTGGAEWEEKAAGEEIDDASATAWLSSCVEPDELCKHMRRTVATHSKTLRVAGEDGGAHDSMRDAAWAVLGDANDGHAGVVKALGKLRDVFLAAVRKRRGDERLAVGEWKRAVFRGISKIIEGGGQEVVDPCVALVSTSDLVRPVFQFTEFGNAQRLAKVMNGRARWIPEYKCWYVWDTVRWTRDTGGQVTRWAWKAIDLITEELANIGGTTSDEDEDKFKKHQKNSEKDSMISAMERLVRHRPGIPISAELLDGNPRLLNCPNGTLELTDDGSRFRRSQRAEDYLTLVAGAPYVPDARSELWDDYLERFFPDQEIRDWLQLLVGYSLFGANDEQLMVIGWGGTSTGKTTFKEAIEAALGMYAGVLEKSVFRADIGDRPRPDILKAMPRRLVISEEFSGSEVLHVDQIKYITGAGRTSARGMRSDIFLERTPAFTPWLLTNEFPQIKGGDLALQNRVLVVPFASHMPRTRSSARARRWMLEEVHSAVLAWAVAGWDAYCQGKDVRDVPAGALDANARFIGELSDFHTFLSTACDRGPDYVEVPSRLYEAYEHWCGLERVPERDRLSSTAFGRHLSAMGIHKPNRKVTIDGKQTYLRHGVRLVSEWAKIVETQ